MTTQKSTKESLEPQHLDQYLSIDATFDPL